MKITSLELKEMRFAFSTDLKEIKEGLGRAVKGKLSEDEIGSFILAGKTKETDYQKLLSTTEGQANEDIIADFGSTIKRITERISNLESR